MHQSGRILYERFGNNSLSEAIALFDRALWIQSKPAGVGVLQ